MSNWFTDTVSELSGNIEKAVVAVYPVSNTEITINPAAPAGTAKKSAGGLGSLSNVSALADKASAAAKEAEKLARQVDAVAEKAGLSSMTKSLKGAVTGIAERGMTDARLFTVQFNPSELQFTGYGGGRVAMTDFSKKGDDAYAAAMPARIVLTVKLIFDQVDPQDAFMGDKFTGSATSILKGVTKAGLKLAGKKSNSVQQQVEGFVGAIRDENTRGITFAWGNLSYSGILNHVSTQYTMFNVTGEPVRGTVQLSIVCADTVKVGDQNTLQGLGQWQKMYDKAFVGDSKSLVGAAQKVSNLLNFNT